MVLGRKNADSFGESVLAVSIGVGTLPGNWLPRLSAPEREAEDIANALQRQDGCGVPFDRIGEPLIGAKATRDEVITRLRSLAVKSTADDTIIIYFSGHGVFANETFYLCTSNAVQSDLDHTAVSGADLGEVLENAVCRGILIILDCCHSAAAAEHPRSALRSLRSGEFRLLLSSTRAQTNAWETADGQGTGFSGTLIEILKGTRVIGRGDGAIYFSDLMEGLKAGVEERRVVANLPPQDIVYTGTSTSDPLVLVMRGQTLKSIRFATARYSTRQLQRFVARSVLGLLATISFCLIAWYGIIDATQYVVEEGGRLAAFRGHPRYSLPGYPTQVWTYSFGAEQLREGEERKLPIVAGLGEAVAPLVQAHLHPLVLASQMADAGLRDEVRLRTRALFEDRTVPFETQFGARLLFAENAGPADEQLIIRWIHDSRSEIRLAALRALLRINPRRAIDNAINDLALGTLNHEDFLRRLQGECSPDIERYLRRAAQASGASFSASLVVNATVRVGCHLDAAFVVDLVRQMQHRDAASVAGYAVWSHVTVQSAALDNSIGAWRGPLFEAYLPQAACNPSWQKQLSSERSDELLVVAMAMARHCPNAKLLIHWSSLDDNNRIALISKEEKIREFSAFPGRAGVGLFAEHVGLLALLADRDFKNVHALLPLVFDAQLRTTFLRLLTYWGDKEPIYFSAGLLDANDIDLRRVFADHERMANSPELLDNILTRVGRSDPFYTSIAGRMPLTDKARSRIAALLSGTTNERRTAACILAMQSPAKQVLTLLTAIDADIRTEAMGCAPYNSAAKAIAEALPKSAGSFPIEGYTALQEQVRLKTKFETDLASMPPNLRAWRLAVEDITPGSFGVWGRGMRDWILEQRLQSERLRRN